MSDNFTAFLFEQAWMKIVRVLLLSKQARCLRELVDLSGVSLAGVQDVVRRLEARKVIVRKRVGNKVFLSLALTEAEAEFLQHSVKREAKRELLARAERYSDKREQAVGWIDETVKTWRRGRRQVRDTA